MIEREIRIVGVQLHAGRSGTRPKAWTLMLIYELNLLVIHVKEGD
jgi:hypothetical protein